MAQKAPVCPPTIHNPGTHCTAGALTRPDGLTDSEERQHMLCALSLFPSHKARALLLCQSSQLRCQFMRISCTVEVSSAQLYWASEQRGRLPHHSSPWGKEVQWWGLGQPKHRSSTGIAIVRSPLLVRNDSWSLQTPWGSGMLFLAALHASFPDQAEQ